MAQDDFFICKAEEGGVAVATATDDNAADEKSDKSIWQLLNIRCTSTFTVTRFALRRKAFFKHALDVAGGDQPQAENPACRILFYWDFCELRSKKHFAENSCLIK